MQGIACLRCVPEHIGVGRKATRRGEFRRRSAEYLAKRQAVDHTHGSMDGKAEILRGPWPALRGADDPRTNGSLRAGREAEAPAGSGTCLTRESIGSGKMMLGFVVRECSVALGHEPSPQELAEWANHQQDDRGEFCLFGRAITPAEARVILAHPGRPVSVRPERMRPHAGGEPAIRSRS